MPPSFDALRNLTNFVSTPGADRYSRRGCELMNKYLLETEGRGFACLALAYNPETEKQYGKDVMNDLLTRSVSVIRNANRLCALAALLEVDYADTEPHIDKDTIEGFRHILDQQIPALIHQVIEMTRLARSIMHTVEV